ncbi:hypothetical protein BC826DRAFT_566735 [Russula brevipes]|nr:hypothetical protein BC826DRAFT_566735 [Russula brevipes]
MCPGAGQKSIRLGQGCAGGATCRTCGNPGGKISEQHRRGDCRVETDIFESSLSVVKEMPEAVPRSHLAHWAQLGEAGQGVAVAGDCPISPTHLISEEAVSRPLHAAQAISLFQPVYRRRHAHHQTRTQIPLPSSSFHFHPTQSPVLQISKLERSTHECPPRH